MEVLKFKCHSIEVMIWNDPIWSLNLFAIENIKIWLFFQLQTTNFKRIPIENTKYKCSLSMNVPNHYKKFNLDISASLNKYK